MTRQAKDEAREERIHMEIIVDAYGPEEQAAGWYNYLADTLQFPSSVSQAVLPESCSCIHEPCP